MTFQLHVSQGHSEKKADWCIHNKVLNDLFKQIILSNIYPEGSCLKSPLQDCPLKMDPPPPMDAPGGEPNPLEVCYQLAQPRLGRNSGIQFYSIQIPPLYSVYSVCTVVYRM